MKSNEFSRKDTLISVLKNRNGNFLRNTKSNVIAIAYHIHICELTRTDRTSPTF